MGKEVGMLEDKKCDWCSARAEYDFKTCYGAWGYGCAQHWIAYRRYPTLGTGLGQHLVYGRESHAGRKI